MTKYWWHYYGSQLAFSFQCIILIFFNSSFNVKAHVLQAKPIRWLTLAIVFAFYDSFINYENVSIQNRF